MLPQLILFKPSYNRVNFSKYFKGFFMFFLKFFLKKHLYNKCYPNWICLSLAIVELTLFGRPWQIITSSYTVKSRFSLQVFIPQK